MKSYVTNLDVRAWVLSIPHSGTRSLRECIFGVGYSAKPKKGSHVAYINHLSYKKLPKNIIVVTPLREPREMWKSWVKRYNDGTLRDTMNSCSPFPSWRGPGPKYFVKNWQTADDLGLHQLDLFEQQFRNLQLYDDIYKIFYVPVDTSVTDERIKILGDFIGKKLSFNKQKLVGHVEGGCTTDYPEPDWDYIYNLPFIRQFYKEAK
jgi:hypothetical protein